MIFTSKSDFVQAMNDANSTGSLLPPKHDPNDISITRCSDRSVVSFTVSSSLMSLINSCDYDLYYHPDYRGQSLRSFYVLCPHSSSGLTDLGNWVLSGSSVVGDPLDRLVFVSGSTVGWHVFAETSSTITNRVGTGLLGAGQLVN